MVDLPDDNREAAINAITLPEVNSYLVKIRNIKEIMKIICHPSKILYGVLAS